MSEQYLLRWREREGVSGKSDFCGKNIKNTGEKNISSLSLSLLLPPSSLSLLRRSYLFLSLQASSIFESLLVRYRLRIRIADLDLPRAFCPSSEPVPCPSPSSATLLSALSVSPSVLMSLFLNGSAKEKEKKSFQILSLGPTRRLSPSLTKSLARALAPGPCLSLNRDAPSGLPQCSLHVAQNLPPLSCRGILWNLNVPYSNHALSQIQPDAALSTTESRDFLTRTFPGHWQCASPSQVKAPPDFAQSRPSCIFVSR